jgi:uncharacterized membrane protein YbhN (UPF0104 family)
VLCAGLLGLAALLLLDYLPRPLLRFRLIAPLAELARESRRLFAHAKRCSAVIGLSALTTGLSVLALKLVADGVGTRLSLGNWMMIVAPVTLIQLLPLSLAGWGVREVVLVVALSLFGVSAESALATSVLFGLCILVISLPGGLIWLTDWDIAPRWVRVDRPDRADRKSWLLRAK